MPDAPTLPRLQQWMQAVLVHPSGADAGIASTEATRWLPRRRAERLIRNRGGLGAVERLAIYADMYPLRMREALEADYPALLTFLGDGFETFARDYVDAFPSRSYTLARLGDHVVEFAAGWGPRKGRTLLADIARLELAATEVFDAADVPALSAASFGALDKEGLDRTVLRASPAFRLLRVRVAAADAFDAARVPKAVSREAKGLVWIALFRRDGRVLSRRLEAVEGRLLSRLLSGAAVGRATAALKSKGARGPAPKAVSHWFAGWMSSGFFSAFAVVS